MSFKIGDIVMLKDDDHNQDLYEEYIDKKMVVRDVIDTPAGGLARVAFLHPDSRWFAQRHLDATGEHQVDLTKEQPVESIVRP